MLGLVSFLNFVFLYGAHAFHHFYVCGLIETARMKVLPP